MTDKKWNYPVAKAALEILGLAADLGKVTTDALGAALTTYSEGVKDLSTDGA